ncbi:MAG TPA: sigma-70 family RNA polymerase sigma factor [Bacteroidia bacterium]|jgi:RNA polymerase sigma factor (sigma-70 family)|nr:sigma-70 family RNA polymerase sigma factor [Bacteroidia bacterium]
MSDSKNSELYKTVDHLFRQESGKMVSVLVRIFGFPNIEQAEDIVQDTILKALEVWKWGKVPENPRAWLYSAAKNKAIDVLRRQQLKYKVDSDISYLLKSEYTLAPALNEMFTENEIKDSQLRMMFACCHSSFTQEAQITLILKTLCGLSSKEIGDAFLSNEETIQKRIYRTKEKIKEENISLDYPGADAMTKRTDAVLKTLYLLFNEGYSSSHPQKLIREDLCEEAMRLCILLSENPKTNLPQTNALLALMCYHVSRFNTRLDDKGLIVLLKDQDRNQWNKFLIAKGNEYMNQSAFGEMCHDFHIEAAIASLHANAGAYENTNWKLILGMYDTLLNRGNNPMVAINRAVVLGEVEGYEKAISELEKLTGFSENCYYNTSLAEMYMKAGNKESAKKIFGKALELTSSNAEIELIRRKIKMCT